VIRRKIIEFRGGDFRKFKAHVIGVEQAGTTYVTQTHSKSGLKIKEFVFDWQSVYHLALKIKK
jgi:hypothetical protein